MTLRIPATALAFILTGCSASNDDANARAQRAREDSVVARQYARFGRPPLPIRGYADSTLHGSLSERLEVYAPLIPQADTIPSEADSALGRPWLEARLLPHEGHYGNYVVMDTALLRALLARGSFEGACTSYRAPPCSNTAQPIYIYSAIYPVAPGVARVFRAWSDREFATEVMYRLEKRANRWVVVDSLTVMIT